jgi:hypothetical protein
MNDKNKTFCRKQVDSEKLNKVFLLEVEGLPKCGGRIDCGYISSNLRNETVSTLFTVIQHSLGIPRQEEEINGIQIGRKKSNYPYLQMT